MDKDKIYNKDIVMYSIVNLTRNINEIPFSYLINNEQFRVLFKYIEKIFLKEEEKNNFIIINEEEEKNWLKENHILDNINNLNRITKVISNKTKKNCIILNQKEHILLSTISEGLNFNEIFKEVNSLDDSIEECVEYAFNENLGYLTSFPSEIGSGFKVGVIIHLPAIALNNGIKDLKYKLSKENIELLPMYVNGIEEIGYIYKVFTKFSNELSEIEIIQNFKAILYEIILKEKNTRDKLMEDKEIEVKDMIFRALGLIKNFYLIDLCESIRLMSYIRFGIEIGLITHIELSDVDELFFEIQPISIQRKYKESNLNFKEINIKRAEFLREWIEKLDKK
ncbi:hypothetical protein [Clostridium tarantellae]|uniref:Phosphagen kinase C-terminal domain-containing protein n=1 Tax=Clostridium tarantellae TaxID=39493 RepID=A0A6I1MGQ3_9CLOT|nr:hypothetical protein [Clostridium tarantellae]MPQ42350.1 hypothetical protein [Clostridium tarantellae]